MRPLYLVALSSLVAGDITVPVDRVRPLPLASEPAESVADMFRRSCPESLEHQPEIVLSSYGELQTETGVHPSSESLVRGVIDAWARHQPLALRPDEVWFEILAQLNFYMSAHADDVRHLFVDHQGQEEIEVWRHDLRSVVAAFGGEIQSRVRADRLLEWIRPGFSTSTADDGLAATVLVMGLMRHFLAFSGGIVCGLPSVTLRDERADWVRLLGKLDRLADWGKDPTAYAAALRPILARFVHTWDEPDSQRTRAFWSQIVRARAGFSCGPVREYVVSGWISGFLHWREDGSRREGEPGGVVLDGVTYAPEELGSLSVGYAKAPLKMFNYPQRGVHTHASLLAGNIGINRTGVTQPLSDWFLYAPDTNSTWRGAYELNGIVEGLETCMGGRDELWRDYRVALARGPFTQHEPTHLGRNIDLVSSF